MKIKQRIPVGWFGMGIVAVVLAGAGCGKKKPAGEAPSAGSGERRPAAAGTPDPTGDAVRAAQAEVGKIFAAKPTAPGADGERTGKLIDAAVAAIHDVPRDAWDPAAVVAAVGKDRAALFAWVRDRTALVPYRGSLRGATGVLMDRVGNSLDRALLLAELLEQAGLEVRLANAQLEPDALAKLAAVVRVRPPLPTPPAFDRGATLQALAGAFSVDAGSLKGKLEAFDAAQRALGARTTQRIKDQAAAIAKLVPPGPAGATTDWSAAADHWWVQVHDGEAWADLDPSLATSKPGEALASAASETLAPRDLADDRRHTLTVRVIAEVWHGDNRDEAVLLEHRFAPAQYYGQPIVVSHAPVDWPEPETFLAAPDPGAAARKSLVAQTEWIPMVMIGSTPVVKMSVRDDGEMFDLTDANGNTTRLGRAVQQATKNGVGGAMDVLDQMPDGTGSDGAGSAPAPAAKPAAGTAFTAEWLELQIDAPGAAPVVQRRVVFDLLGGAAARAPLRSQLSDAARLDRAFALVATTELMGVFARTPPGFVLDRLSNSLVAARPVLVELAGLAGKFPSKDLRERAGNVPPLPGTLTALAVARFEDSPVADQIYLDRLDVLVHRQQSIGVGRTRETLDIVANRVAVWPGAADPRSIAITQGVADTVAETLVLGCAAPACSKGLNASDHFAAALGKGWVVASAADALPAAVRTDALADATAGYVIVASPDRTPAWWRVDASTGETLGMTPLGGSVFAETLKQLTVTMISGGFCFWNYTTDQPSWHLLACVIGTGMGLGGSLLGAGAAGATAAGTASAAWQGVDWLLTVLGAVTNGVGGHNFGP